MTNQPEALRLAEYLETYGPTSNINFTSVTAAAELRRLHEVNQELMKAIANGLDLPFGNEIAWFEWRNSAEAALSKATGESND